MGATVSELSGATTMVARRGLRLFATPVDEPRARRVTDGIKIVVATVVLALLGLLAVPSTGIESALIDFLRVIPSSLDGAWQFVLDLLDLAAIALVVVSIVRHRWPLFRDIVIGLALVVLLTSSVARLVEGEWPGILDSLRSAGPPPLFPSLRIAVPAAAIMVTSPHLTRSMRRLGRWLVALAAISATVLEVTTPSGAVAGVFVAVIAAACVHLAFGSPRGRPSLNDVRAALVDLGVTASAVGAADRQPAGYFLVHAEDEEGDPLIVKVFGRDAYDTQLFSTLWRTIWYREAGSPISSSRLPQVEHEAFLTLLARQAGVLTSVVVTAGETVSEDVLLVLRPAGTPLADAPKAVTDETVRGIWRTVGRLHAASVTHGQIDDRHLVSDGHDIGLHDFRGGTVAPEQARVRTDQAQAFVTTVLLVGEERALDLAIEQLGRSELSEIVPYVQVPALTDRQRTAIRQEKVELDDLRDHASQRLDVPTPELQRLRRVTWGTVLQLVLLVVAFVALVTAFAGLDLQEVANELQDAIWWYIVAGFIIAQSARVTQSISTLGASPIPLPLRPVYALQLAISYVNLAVPSTAARVAVNIRFFQRHGVPPGSAVTIGALDGFSGFIVQCTLMISILLFSSASLNLSLGRSSSDNGWSLLLIIVAIAVAAVAVVLIIPKIRRPLFAKIRELLHDARGTISGLRSPRRLLMLFGGNLATELLFATALGAMVRAMGYPVPLADLVLINVTVAVLAGFLPIPGGIGVTEGGLTYGLMQAGVPEEAAFAAVIVYRIASFYLPPVWGFFALRWLEKTKQL